MARLIPYVLYLWLVSMFQVFLGDAVSILGVKINIAVLIVLLVAVYKSEVTAIWFGFSVGIIANLGASSLMGWQVLILALTGFAAFHIREKLNLESLMAKLVLVCGGAVTHNVITLLLSGNDGFFLLLLTNALPGAVYTTLAGWAFFLFKEGKVTFRKAKEIF